MNFNETTTYLLTQISTFLKVEIEKQLAQFDLHSGQIFVLFELWNTDGQSQIEIANRLRLSPPTINKMVKSLTQNGFVATKACPHDGRIMRVYITPKGAAIRPSVEEKWRKLDELLGTNLTPTEQLVLTQLFSKLLENLSLPKNSN